MPLSLTTTRDLLTQLNHQAKHFLGQNFLVDGNIVHKSLELAGIGHGDTVVEIGLGFQLARLRGSAANDNMADGKFLSNNAGGILGGISTGEPIILRLVVKPTSSIAKQQNTMNTAGENCTIEVHGRHDPCIVPRAVPVVENMAALILLDAWEIQARLRPDWADQVEAK